MAEGLRSNDTTDKIDDVVSKIQVLTNQNNQVQETLQTISTMLTSLESKEVSGAMNNLHFSFRHLLLKNVDIMNPGTTYLTYHIIHLK